MSTDYDIHCLDCGEWVKDWRDETKKVWCGENTGFNDFRDGEALHAMLAAPRPALESMGMAMAAMSWHFTDEGSRLHRLLYFFGRHAGHSLEVRNEYGENWATCVANFARYEAERRAAAIKKVTNPETTP